MQAGLGMDLELLKSPRKIVQANSSHLSECYQCKELIENWAKKFQGLADGLGGFSKVV
jgi:hypothetical protein